MSSAQPRSGDHQVLVINTVGELQSIASASDVVFVGGSLVPFGGHNIIEPASLARPVIIGPHHGNFRSVVDEFVRRDALTIVKDGTELLDQLRRLKNDPERSRRLGERAAETVMQNAGASQRTIEALAPLVQRIEAGHRPVATPEMS